MSSGQAPLVRSAQQDVPAAAAATAQDVIVTTAPYQGSVSGVRFTPEAGITGATLNFRTFRLLNRGQDGTGTTVVASLAFNDAAVTAAAFDARDIPLSTAAGATAIAEGDVLVWDETVTGTGLASPGGQVQVFLARG